MSEKYSYGLPQGESYVNFMINLENNTYTINLIWNENAGFYMVEIITEQGDVVLGKGLHPNIDLFKGQNILKGRLYLEGEAATRENLGKENRLVYESL